MIKNIFLNILTHRPPYGVLAMLVEDTPMSSKNTLTLFYEYALRRGLLFPQVTFPTLHIGSFTYKLC